MRPLSLALLLRPYPGEFLQWNELSTTTEAAVASSRTSPSPREVPVVDDHGFEVAVVCRASSTTPSPTFITRSKLAIDHLDASPENFPRR
jgi:hypothetical protein